MPDFAANYRRMTDEQLAQIAVRGAGLLEPEAATALRAELVARGIDPAVARRAAVPQMSEQDLDVLVEELRQQPCPECDRTDQRLNAGIVANAKSFLVVTLYDWRTLLACPDCLVRQARSAAIVTALLGWWGIPMGPIRAVQALYHDIRTLLTARSDEATPALRTLVRKNPGAVVVALSR